MSTAPPIVANQTIADFLDQLASAQPTPGGGGAAALAGAAAAALAAMVVRFAVGKPRYAQHAALHERSLAEFDGARAELLRLADRDATEYAALNAAMAQPKDAPTRSADIAAAAGMAIATPAAGAQVCMALAVRMAELRGATSPHLASDLAIAASLAETACRGFGHLVRANAPLLAEPALATRYIEDAGASAARAAEALASFST
jgi:formiminotetrahydrofolate cyclodeaminase